MKDKILSLIDMNDILDKYNIKRNKNQFCCPFHQDKTPSAKSYEKSFYCFGCGKTGDIIQFVQYLFNLNFKEAMQKINEDFSLNLNSKIKINYSKINNIKQARDLKKQKKEKLENDFKELCNLKEDYKNKIQYMETQILLNNWEDKMNAISIMQDEIGKIDMELDYLLDEMYKLKNSN